MNRATRRPHIGTADALKPALAPVTPRSRFGPVGDWLRRGVFRAARPVIFAEHQVHMDLARGIESATETTRIPEELDESEILDVATDVGQLFLHRRDTVMTPSISEDGYWEREEGNLLRALLRPGHMFLDVGANVGYMTLLGAHCVGDRGRVIAVEPEPGNLRLLRANLWRNGLCARVLPVAAYSRCGFIGFVRKSDNLGGHEVREGIGHGSLVPCARLDELLADVHVDVAKIDTEGVDHEVLEGMRGLVDRNPAIVVLSEFLLAGLEQRGLDPAAALDRYRRLGFTVGMLSNGNGVRPADAQDVLAACRAWPGLYVNLVLAGPERSLTDLV